MSTRNYNKLYVHTNREEGSEKILVGYQNDARELILTKDTETLFHVPYYADLVKLVDSTLIQDGATAGPFPAAADRIFKNNKNYGNVTSNGSPSSNADGGWFCSWLYEDEYGNVQWMDRYYNPGAFVAPIAVSQLSETRIYKKNDPVFRDVPSTMIFEPGVQYRYFHIGEKSAKDIISTFSGNDKTRLRLNLENWGSDIIDTSLFAKKVNINTNGSLADLYSSYTETNRVSAASISFDNTYNTTVFVDYDDSYALLNEFSLTFWVHSNQWNESQSTQLVGNFSSRGGVGVFIDTLSSYPFFVIPETGYGHLLYVNEGLNPFLDKSVQLTTLLTATPQFVAIDSDNNVVVCYNDNSRRLNKFDNVGTLLATTTLEQQTETPIQLLCGPDDTIIVITDKAKYTYDTNLAQIALPIQIDPPSKTIAAFSYNIEQGTSELLFTKNVYDSKFIETDHWCLSATNSSLTNGNLFVKYTGDTEYIQFTENLSATTFGIDPYDRLWVLHANNDVAVYDSSSEPLSEPVFTFEAGQDVPHVQKNISFLCTYDRSTASREWKCVIYYADEKDSTVTPQLYVFDMKGMLVQTVDLLSLFNQDVVAILDQSQSNFQFLGMGDFTGYERRRVFNKLPPYNNEPQIIIRASLKNSTKTDILYDQFKAFASIAGWDNKSWQHITLILQNRVFNLYSNGIKIAELPYFGEHELSYTETQPDLFIGSPVGAQFGFNEEIKHSSAIFNGIFQDIKIYDYALDPIKIELFQRSMLVAQSIYWSLPTPLIQYIEKIERMFKNKIPGAKSSYFNIKLCGTQIKDSQTRLIIEQEILELISKIKPAYADFLRVHWVD